MENSNAWQKSFMIYYFDHFRLLAGVWYLFAMLIIASYTANLAAFLTVETLERPIKSAEDLAHQTEIKYGVVKGGSTMKFFERSNHATYKILWEFMEGIYLP